MAYKGSICNRIEELIPLVRVTPKKKQILERVMPKKPINNRWKKYFLSNNIFQFPLRTANLKRKIPAIRLLKVAKNKGFISPVPYLMIMGSAPAIKIVMITNIIPSLSVFSNMFTPIELVNSVKTGLQFTVYYILYYCYESDVGGGFIRPGF